MPLIASLASASVKAFGLTSFVGAIKDLYFRYVRLLLNAELSTPNIGSDESSYKSSLRVLGDAKPSVFTPYLGDGYYSNYFNGTTDGLTIPQTFSLATSTTPFTLEAWVYVTAYTSVAIAATSYAGSGAIPFVLGMGATSKNGGDAGGYPFLNYYNGSAWSTGVISSIIVPLHTWTHVAGVFDGANAKVYVGGALGGTWAAGAWQTTGQNNFYVGRRWDTAGNNYFTGYISNFRFVNGTAVYTGPFIPSKTPLTAITNTVVLTCQSNRFLDNSANAYSITRAGTPIVTANTPFARPDSTSSYGSAYFDGTGDALIGPGVGASNIGYSFNTNPFTVEFWVYVPGAATTDTGFIDARTATTVSPWSIYSGGATNTPYFFDGSTYSSTIATVRNAWNHIAVSRSAGTLKIFVNGVQGYSGAHSTALMPQAGIVIGSGTTNGSAYQSPSLGYFADVRIVNGTGLYTANFTPPVAPLAKVDNTALLTCRTPGGITNYGIMDSSPSNNPITRLGNSSQGSFSPYSNTGWSVFFNSSTDFITTASSASLTLASSNFTIECWFNTFAKTNLYPVILSNGNFGAGKWQLDDRHNTYPNKLIFGVYGALTTPNFLVSTTTITNNTWYHVAIVRNGSTFTMYLNGVPEATNTYAGAVDTGAQTVYIGQDAGQAGTKYNGNVSNFRIVTSAVYTSAFVPPTAPLTAITGTQLLTCQSNRFIDKSTNAIALTPTGTPMVQAYSPFGTVTDTKPASYQVVFNGTNAYLTANSTTPIGTSDVTIECWVYFNAFGSWSPIYTSVSFGTYASGAMLFAVTGSGYLRLDVANGAGSSVPILSTASPVFNTATWYHVAYARTSGGASNLFVNGVSVATRATDTYDWTGTSYTIGDAYFSSGPITLYLNGYITNFRVTMANLYPTAFTPSATPLTKLAKTTLLTCNSTAYVDQSDYSIPITVSGTPSIAASSLFGNLLNTGSPYAPSDNGGSAYFDGTGDYLTVANSTAFSLPGNFTIEFWAYVTSFTSAAYLFTMGNTTAGSMGISIFCTASDWRMQVGTVTTATTSINSVSVYTNTWYHVACVRNGSVITLYINGTALGSTITTSATVTGVAGNGISINAYYNGSYTVGSSAYISNVRVTNSAAIYSGVFLPPTSPVKNLPGYPSLLLLNFDSAGIADYHSGVVLETGNNIGTSTAVTKYGNSSVFFGGTNSALNFNALNQYLYAVPGQHLMIGPGDFTIEVWIYPLAYTGSGVHSWLFDTRPAAASTGAFLSVYLTQVSGVTVVYGGATGATALLAAAAAPALNQWTHVAVTRTGTTMKLFHNGVQTGASATDSTNYNLTGLFIGTHPSIGNHPFYGYMDEIRLTVGVSRYATDFGPPAKSPTQ